MDLRNIVCCGIHHSALLFVSDVSRAKEQKTQQRNVISLEHARKARMKTSKKPNTRLKHTRKKHSHILSQTARPPTIGRILYRADTSSHTTGDINNRHNRSLYLRTYSSCTLSLIISSSRLIIVNCLSVIGITERRLPRAVRGQGPRGMSWRRVSNNGCL